MVESMEWNDKTINGSVPHKQVSEFLRRVRIVSHQEDYTAHAIYEAVKGLLEIDGLGKPEIYYLSLGEHRD